MGATETDWGEVMSLTEMDIVNLRPQLVAFTVAVANEDAATIDRVYREIRTGFQVDPAHAMAVMLADEVKATRERWARTSSEATQYAAAYLDEKRKVRELRDLLDAKAEAAPKRRKDAA